MRTGSGYHLRDWDCTFTKNGKYSDKVMELTTTKYDFLGLMAVVASPRMHQTLGLVERAARTPATVLIEGESGCGKEVVARAIHQLSLRCSRPWVDINCGALPDQLMESELFGHERGAFSGADCAKPGLFEMAHTGTIFLDEIGELDPRMQVKLLRVLDGQPYYRLGGVKKINVDVRVVAATNVPLEAAVQAGRFRNDLYHRLSMMRINVPPLRTRLEDIEPLARHFLWLHGVEKAFSARALQALLRYNWPGNVRELKNVVYRAAVLCDEPVIGEEHLGLPAPEPMVLAPAALTAAAPVAPRGEPGTSLDGLERQAILSILRQTNGHRQRAADLLGISRRTLSRKLKQYSSEEPEEDAGWDLSREEWTREAVHGKTA